MLEKIVSVIIANMLPTVEQVGAIPLGIALGLPLEYIFIISVITNPLVFFPVYFVLEFFYQNILSKIKRFDNYLVKIRRKGKPYVDKYGIAGITIFVIIPAPFTGTYTATILSWLLGLNIKKSFIAILLGSVIRTIMIFSAALGVLSLFSVIGL
jgi:uncharacterized membrane protein